MAVLAPVLKQRFFNSNGDPLSGGKLYAYAAGTTTLQDTYTSQDGSSSNTNPIILDADGEADVWISEAGYKFALFDSSDVPQWTVDNVYSSLYAQSTSSDLIDNLSITCSVAANQLTIALKDASGAPPSIASSVKVGIRSATLLSGVVTKLVISAPLSLTISAGSTLGHNSAQESPIYVGILNNSGVAELCACTLGFDETKLITTVAEGGAGAADSPSAVYSATARTSVPVRNICKLLSTQTTAGTWAVVPTNTAVGDAGKFAASILFPLPSFGGSSLNYPSNQVVKTGIHAGTLAWSQANFGEYGAFSSTIAVDPVYGYCDCSSGAITLTLPTAVGRAGKTIVFTKTDSNTANIITLDGLGTETIGGLLTTTLTVQYQSITIYSDGANWKVLTSNKQPTIQKFTTGSGTYTTPLGVKYITVEMAGGGGGSSGMTTGNAGASGGAGGTTTFDSSLLTCTGGAGGVHATLVGGAGGTGTLNLPAVGISINGTAGSAAGFPAASGAYAVGGNGGATPFGGASAGKGTTTAASVPSANTGSGAGASGNSTASSTNGGAAGGAGAYIKATILAPSTTYAYAVGAGGTAGTGTAAGAAGAAGIIIVTEYYS